MKNIKRTLAIAALVIGLFALPTTTHAFSFKSLIQNIFGSKQEQQLPNIPLEADVSKATTTTSSTATSATKTTTATSTATTADTSTKVTLTADQTKQLQLDLATLGYYSGSIDGIYGPLTTAAVSKFQTASAIPATGTTDQKTMDALQRLCLGKCPIFSNIQCIDGKDNDGDGLTDYPADPGCTSILDTDESNAMQGITIISPNGGERYQQGQQITVRWTSTGYSKNALVKIYLSTQDSTGSYSNTFFFPGNQIADDGNETLSIPSTVPNGSNYVIRIEIAEPRSLQFIVDHSDKTFSIGTSQCSDGIDNDNDGLVDYPSDPGCSSATDNDEYNAPACTITSFTVPATTTIASNLSITASWTTSGCTGVEVISDSGYGYSPYIATSSTVATGSRTFTANPSASIAEKFIDVTIIATNGKAMASTTKTVTVSGVSAAATNQCSINSFTTTPATVSSAGGTTTLAWSAPAGCSVFLRAVKSNFYESFLYASATPSAFPSSGTYTITSALPPMTYYLFAQAGVGNTAVLSAKTVVVGIQ